MGPFVVPAPLIRSGDDIRIKLKVNGQFMQDWPVPDMIFKIPQVLAYASEGFRLMPGDVTDSEITHLGRQRNRCVAEDAGGRTPVHGLWKNR
jgi:hypothetical protein